EQPLLPIIIITARPNQLFTSLGIGAGALIEKPLDFLKLLETIRALLNEKPEARMARVSGHSAHFHYIRPNGNEVTYSSQRNDPRFETQPHEPLGPSHN